MCFVVVGAGAEVGGLGPTCRFDASAAFLGHQEPVGDGTGCAARWRWRAFVQLRRLVAMLG
jgi:hypothetical protein